MATFLYTTSDGDVLDDICFRYYGEGYNVSPIPFVLNANPGLADLGDIYPAGVLIMLPDLPATTGITSVNQPWT